MNELFKKTYQTVTTSDNNAAVTTGSRHHNKHIKHHKKPEVRSVEQANTVKKPDNLRMVGLSVEGLLKYNYSGFDLEFKGTFYFLCFAMHSLFIDKNYYKI